MILELTEQEREVLLRLVEREISDLGPEIRRTRTSSLRNELKVHKQDLRKFVERLRTSEGQVIA